MKRPYKDRSIIPSGLETIPDLMILNLRWFINNDAVMSLEIEIP